MGGGGIEGAHVVECYNRLPNDGFVFVIGKARSWVSVSTSIDLRVPVSASVYKNSLSFFDRPHAKPTIRSTRHTSNVNARSPLFPGPTISMRQEGAQPACACVCVIGVPTDMFRRPVDAVDVSRVAIYNAEPTTDSAQFANSPSPIRSGRFSALSFVVEVFVFPLFVSDKMKVFVSTHTH